MNSNSKNQENKKEMTDKEFVAAILTVGVIILGVFISKNETAIRRYYFMNFSYIWGGAATLFLGLMYFIKRKYIKSTDDLYKRYEDISRAWSAGSDSIYVGKTEDCVSQYVTDSERTGHVQVIGATGRGKTQSVIIPWSVQDQARNKDVIIVDGKGSYDLVEATSKDKKPILFDLSDRFKNSVSINPLESGSAQEITDRIFASFDFKDPYFKSVQYDICLSLVTRIKQVDGIVTFKGLHRALTDSDHLLENYMSDKMDESLYKSLDEFLRLKPDKRSERVSGLASQLAPLATGELSYLLNGIDTNKANNYRLQALAKKKMEAAECLETYLVLEKAVNTNDFTEAKKYLGIEEDQKLSLVEDDHRGYLSFEEILVTYKMTKRPKFNEPVKKKDSKTVIVLLPTLKYQKIAGSVGKLICQQIAWCVGERENKGITDFTPIFMDEFSSFVYEGFYQMLNKARSSGIALHLAHQSISDLESISPDFAKSINTNTNVKCILGVNDPDTAEFFARHLGTKKASKMTERFDSEDIENDRRRYMANDRKSNKIVGSIRQVESYKVHPNDLKYFSAGHGVLHIPKASGPLTQKIRFYGMSKVPTGIMREDNAYVKRA